jgi:hypothetical protein
VIFDFLVRQRLPAFMKQSPLDGNVTRRVKMAAGIVENLGYDFRSTAIQINCLQHKTILSVIIFNNFCCF